MIDSVINGLRSCQKNDCSNCQYHIIGSYSGDCIANLIRDTLTVLKAHEPRLMTLDDLYYGIEDGMQAYIETRHDGRPCILISHHAYPSWCYRTEIERHGVWIMDKHNMRRRWECKNYNKTWRVWTDRPTDEQREAVAWED